MKFPGGVFLCVVKVHCLEEVAQYSTKPVPVFAQSSRAIDPDCPVRGGGWGPSGLLLGGCLSV